MPTWPWPPSDRTRTSYSCSKQMKQVEERRDMDIGVLCRTSDPDISAPQENPIVADLPIHKAPSFYGRLAELLPRVGLCGCRRASQLGTLGIGAFLSVDRILRKQLATIRRWRYRGGLGGFPFPRTSQEAGSMYIYIGISILGSTELRRISRLPHKLAPGRLSARRRGQ
ncbi:hypothetical protein BJX70DRAFT_357459 [Aspergillus crustosus]